MSHTELPWEYVPELCSEGNTGNIGSIINHDGWYICEICELYESEEHKANAEFIVRAVNNHDNLLDELKKTVRFLSVELGKDHPFVLSAEEAIKEAEK